MNCRWRRANSGPLEEDRSPREEIDTTEDKWDELFARPEAKRVMSEMAREAHEEYRAGRITGIEITEEDGRLAPAPTADSPSSPSSASAPAAPRR